MLGLTAGIAGGWPGGGIEAPVPALLLGLAAFLIARDDLTRRRVQWGAVGLLFAGSCLLSSRPWFWDLTEGVVSFGLLIALIVTIEVSFRRPIPLGSGDIRVIAALTPAIDGANQVALALAIAGGVSLLATWLAGQWKGRRTCVPYAPGLVVGFLTARMLL